MAPPLDELYFTWLYSQVASIKIANPAKTYWGLCRLLFKKEFIWIIPNDDNRAEDGRDLRKEFLEAEHIVLDDEDWMRFGCSMFELLIGLARRCAFEADDNPQFWFWRLMENTGLDLYTDRRRHFDDVVDNVLDAIIWRTYRPSGAGGLFPLECPEQDQRRVELWYQLCTYMIENGYGY